MGKVLRAGQRHGAHAARFGCGRGSQGHRAGSRYGSAAAAELAPAALEALPQRHARDLQLYEYARPGSSTTDGG